MNYVKGKIDSILGSEFIITVKVEMDERVEEQD